MISKDRLFLGAIAVVVIGASAFFALKYGRQEPLLPEQKMSGATRIVDKTELPSETVVYQNGKFLPQRVQVTEESGCIITILNKSETPLALGLSPHNSTGDPGVAYTLTPPGESILIDPRYRVERIAFHDHLRPEAELEVALEGRCKNF